MTSIQIFLLFYPFQVWSNLLEHLLQIDKHSQFLFYQQDALLQEHASAMKDRVRELKSKGYRDSVDGDVEAVVMFVPSEALLAITFDFERDLHEFAMKNDILIASPVSLLALLRTIAFQWRQVEQAENTREAIEICRELYSRFATWSEHYQKVGDNLKSAITVSYTHLTLPTKA